MRGQLSIFMVLGILLLMAVGLMIYAASFSQESLNREAREAIERSVDLYPPGRFVEYCVQYHTPLLLERIGRGGSLFPADYDYLLHKGEPTRLWYTQQQGNSMLTLQDIETELAQALEVVLLECIDTRVYEQQGFEVSTGELSVQSVFVGPSSVSVDIFFPIRLINDDDSVIVEDYSVQVASYYGELFLLGQDLVNAYVDGTQVDASRVMDAYEVDVLIERPYPNIIYTLSKTFADNLSVVVVIEDVDPFGIVYDASGIVCQTQRTCHAGTVEQLCLNKGGIIGGSCDQIQQVAGDGESCDTTPHGDSWCGSVEGVGGRHYKESCHDGEVVREYCKDFKQEICAIDGSVATCRDNVYEACMQCEDASCCTGDCYWNEVCRPKVAPGIPFWRQDAFSWCAQADVFCDDCDAEYLCAQAGDCGEQMNVYGEGVYVQPPDVSLDFITPPSRQVSFGVEQVASSSLLTRSVAYVNELAQIPLESYLNPQASVTLSSTYGACNVWQPPEESVCSYCMDADLPCSEYLCRSLGQDCFYAQLDGEGICFTRDVSDIKPPELVELSTELSYSPIESNGMLGTFITQQLSGEQPLQVTMEFDEPVLCKMSYLPRAYDDITTHDLTFGIFNQTQPITLRFHDDINVDQFLDVFNVETYADLLQEIVELKTELDFLAQRYPDISRFRTGYYPLINPIVEQFAVNPGLITRLVDALAQREYSAFVQCIDQGGLEYSTFFSFVLADRCADSTPPVIDATLVNGELRVTLNEWSTCKVGDVELECSDVPTDQGYECYGSFNQSVEVSCSDHPEWQVEPIRMSLNVDQGLSRVELSEQANASIGNIVLETKGDYTCLLGDQSISCNGECALDLPRGNYELACYPQVCGVVNTAKRFVEAIELEPVSFQVSFIQEFSSLVITGDELSCRVQYRDSIIELDVPAESSVRVEPPFGRSVAQVTCSSEGYASSSDSVVIIR